MEPEKWATEDLPKMDIDWVRVYINDQHTGDQYLMQSFIK